MKDLSEKCCSVCSVIRPISEFGACGHGGISARCRECKSNSDREYRIRKGEELKAKKREDYHTRQGEKEKYIKRAADWRQQNREKANACTRANHKKNRVAKIKRDNAYISKRRKEDPLFKIRLNFGSRIRGILLGKGLKKTSKFSKYLGCDVKYFKQYIESKFQDGMTWDNYGYYGWHVDHIIPLASAKTEEEIYKLSHYTNLQPLWAIDNFKKGDSLCHLQP